jgi:hypothetical protein
MTEEVKSARGYEIPDGWKRKYEYGRYFSTVTLYIYTDHSIVYDSRAKKIHKLSVGSGFKKAKELSELYKDYGNSVWVTCQHCDQTFDEFEIEDYVTGIHESSTYVNHAGIGADVLTFICPICKKSTESLRRG